MTLVILAAGMGSRYGGGGIKQIDPITEHGEFIIDYSIYDAIQAGFDHVVIVIKKENLETFRETVGARVESKVKVTYVFQDINDLPEGFTCPEGRVKPWGTGHAILAARNVVKDNFAAINADDFYGRDAFMKLAAHLKNAKTENGVSDCCMIGYILRHTLTDNGSVSRGECVVGENGYLESIAERTKIVKGEGVAVYKSEEGNDVELPLDTVVSMNCFGFAAGVMKHFEEGFVEFLKNNSTDLKAEYYCPGTVFKMIRENKATVKVYNTDAKWYGVTYIEDKPGVMAAIRGLIAKGEYPDNLWR